MKQLTLKVEGAVGGAVQALKETFSPRSIPAAKDAAKEQDAAEGEPNCKHLHSMIPSAALTG